MYQFFNKYICIIPTLFYFYLLFIIEKKKYTYNCNLHTYAQTNTHT